MAKVVRHVPTPFLVNQVLSQSSFIMSRQVKPFFIRSCKLRNITLNNLLSNAIANKHLFKKHKTISLTLVRNCEHTIDRRYTSINNDYIEKIFRHLCFM